MADRDIVNTEHAVEMFRTILARSCGVVPTRRGNTNLRANEAAFGWASVLSYELDLERRQVPRLGESGPGIDTASAHSAGRRMLLRSIS